MVVTQPNMQVHEDLAALFSRNLTLDPSQAQQRLQYIQQQEQQQQQQGQQQEQQADQPPPTQEAPRIIYSISQHYNHSAHLARPSSNQHPHQPVERPASEPPQSEHQAVEAVLSSHGVDPSALSRSQLQLFKEAADPQKLRLLELWRICPPTSSRDNPALAWSSTSLEQEEQMARMRFESQAQSQSQQQRTDTAMSLDGTPVPTPFQGGDGRWLSSSPPPPPQAQQVMMHHYMEPYMASGYEELARREYDPASTGGGAGGVSSEPRARDGCSAFGTAIGGQGYSQATDPVFKNLNGGWMMQQQAMENQYGAYAHGRMDF